MSQPHDASPLCILVIDDDQDTVDSFAILLQQLGHAVHTARRGPDALMQIETIHPDLVFLDLALPGMDGFEIAKQIRREPRLSETKIIALTGLSEAKHRLRAQYTGIDGYLVKPATLEEIKASIEAVRNTLLSSGQPTHPAC
ncbi:MAG TPA: response regulator [Pirellulales bacterium]|nr:response regulator [Pirellulales bacterium]